MLGAAIIIAAGLYIWRREAALEKQGLEKQGLEKQEAERGTL